MVRYTPEDIATLGANEIFVFGSNLAGHHRGGAARIAHERFGAVWGIGTGLQGNSYAIPTMQGGIDTIKPYVDEFIRFAKLHPELTFYVTRIGCGIAGFSDSEIAPLFDKTYDVKNIILPESFYKIINHARQLNSETKGLNFHSVPIKFFEEDRIKMESMSFEEQINYAQKLKEKGKYLIEHKSPVAKSFPLLNTTDKGHHVIAIANSTFAIIADNLLYSNKYEWGLDLGQKILSVVAKDASEKDYPYGQFVVLLEDGSICLIWSDICIKKISDNGYISVASGCGGLVFGLRSDGTVDVLFSEKDTMGITCDVKEWTNITQIDAGPRHFVGLRSDGTVIAAGKSTACKPLEEWKDIMKIYVSKASPLYGKENDLTFGIGQDGWLYVDGDCWPKGKEFWRRIRAQYDVSDIIENGCMLWIRTYEGELRCVTYYSKIDYLEEIDFVKKYPDCRFYDSYGDVAVLVDKEGEFHVLYSNREVDWWNM